MYVCLCNAYRERDLVEAARAGACTAEAAYQWLGGPPQCGQCLPTAQAVIDPVARPARHRRAPGADVRS
jgi:bacterioferritin-associated ferredoxin